MKHRQIDLSNLPSLETPLKYMGDKRNFCSCFLEYLPKDTKEIISPFLGGAGLELQLTAFGIKIYGSDFFEPLINFWIHWIKDANLVLEDLMTFYPLPYEERKYYTDLDFKKGSLDFKGNQISDLRRASIYWNTNAISWGGVYGKKSLSRSKRKLSLNRFTKFRNWKNNLITVKYSDYKDILKNVNGKLLYLDPPYLGQEEFYYQKKFDHEELFSILEKTSNWMLSYGDHKVIRNLYKDFSIIEVSWVNKGKTHNELLILNI